LKTKSIITFNLIIDTILIKNLDIINN